MKEFFIGCVVALIFSACSSGYYMKRGNMIYESGRFYKAASRYEKAYHKAKPRKLQAEAAMHAGQSYENVNHFREALNWYRRAERVDKECPEVYLKMARIAVLTDEPENARQYYEEYENRFGDGKGLEGLYYLEQGEKDKQKKGRYSVEFKEEFNSRYSDFSPAYGGEDTCTVYFSSGRNTSLKRKKKTLDPITGEGFSHIFRAEFVEEIRSVDKNGEVKVKKLKEPHWLRPVMLKDSLYSNRNDGALCFTADGKIMYFTSSRMIKGENVGTRIYQAWREGGANEDGTAKKGWTQVSLSGICGDTVSIGHPALTPDGLRMYFATDALPGGFGGKDIWYVDKVDGKWGEPQNAGGLINTAGDEMFPYVRDNGELYFASNGHNGLGGLDILKVENWNGQVVVHLPAPLNSFADDFGIVFKPGQEAGLLTSSRAGRSDGIYSFRFIPQQLQVKMLAKNAVTEQPLAEAGVTVSADDGTVSHLETDSAGMVSVSLLADREYLFVCEKPDYLKGKASLSTYREKGDRLYELVISMQPIERPIVIPNIYFDVAKWELRPDAKENLQELLQILNDNPHITIELSAHTDMAGNDQANMLLSEHRAQAVVDYLIGQGIYWDRLVSKGYGETQARTINEKEAREYPFLKQGDVLSAELINRLTSQQKEITMQLNRRIEFKVLNTNYRPGPNSMHYSNPKVLTTDGGVKKIGKTQLKDLKSLKMKFFTLQLGIFRNVPLVINQFNVVFTEKLKDGTVRYCTGVYTDRKKVETAAANLRKKGIECLIKEFDQQVKKRE